MPDEFRGKHRGKGAEKILEEFEKLILKAKNQIKKSVL